MKLSFSRISGHLEIPTRARFQKEEKKRKKKKKRKPTILAGGDMMFHISSYFSSSWRLSHFNISKFTTLMNLELFSL